MQKMLDSARGLRLFGTSVHCGLAQPAASQAGVRCQTRTPWPANADQENAVFKTRSINFHLNITSKFLQSSWAVQIQIIGKIVESHPG